MTLVLYAFALVAGAFNAIQSGQNITLSRALGQPLLAAIIVALVNIVLFLAMAPFTGMSWPTPERIAGVPWWAWFGGAMGGIYVLAIILTAEKLGAATFTGLTVGAAIITSVVLDHFGWVGFNVHVAGPWRTLGAGLMLVGLALICVF